MSNILQSLGDFIYAVVNLLINIVTGTIQMLTIIPNAVTMLTYSVGYMPSVLVGFAVALISVSIVYLILGR